MFQRLLVPLDGSPRSELVLPRLSHLWKRESSELLLVHCIPADGPTQGREDPLPSSGPTESDGESYLRGVAHRYREEGANVRTRVLQGSPAGAILDAAREEGTTMIAMTTQGRSGILRWLMASVADQVVRGSEVPVFLLRPVDPGIRRPAEREAFREAPFRRILIATDGRPVSMAIVEPARRFAELFGSEIIALHVWDSYGLDGTPLLGMEAGMPPPEEAPLSSEDEVTEQVARQLAPSGLPVTRVTRTGEPAAEILEHCFSENVDLIALATHDHGERSRWMIGGVTERLLRTAGIPLLIVRAAATPELVARHD